MNHVINHSSDFKVFKICFAMFMTVATVVIYSHCGNFVATNSEEVIEQHDVIVQSNNLVKAVNILQPLVVNAATYDNVRIEPLIMIKERQNTLYYVNDNGYNSYLDNCYQDYLYEMCIKYEVEEYYPLFLAQMYHESTFRTNVISKTNDYGLMQINVINHQWLGKKLGDDDFLDPYTNIEAGIYMMSSFLHKYNDVEKALVCYNMGEGAVKKGTYSTTYSRGVLEDMSLLVELD